VREVRDKYPTLAASHTNARCDEGRDPPRSSADREREGRTNILCKPAKFAELRS
jgi:hypothetical protein